MNYFKHYLVKFIMELLIENHSEKTIRFSLLKLLGPYFKNYSSFRRDLHIFDNTPYTKAVENLHSRILTQT